MQALATVARLLRLSRSSSFAPEAQSAALKAKQIILKYGLESDAPTKEPEPEPIQPSVVAEPIQPSVVVDPVPPKWDGWVKRKPPVPPPIHRMVAEKLKVPHWDRSAPPPVPSSRAKRTPPPKVPEVNGFLLSSLNSSTTGIPGVTLWISAGEFAEGEKPHGPRIKVVLGEKSTMEGLENALTVILTNPPQDVQKLPDRIREQILGFARINRDALLLHWNGKIDTMETLSLLRRV
jgi:hypothetical protein